MARSLYALRLTLLGISALAIAAAAPAPDSADLRADALLARMTQAEKLTLVFGYFASVAPWKNYLPPAGARPASAGFVPGIPRLGIPPQWETDAGIGVASQRDPANLRLRTALPSGLATAATWNPDLAFQGGAMIGSEARASGFNVQLAGGVNLARDPRNGRNFEYAGEDPLLAGTIVGAEVRGIESNHIISTVKHFALNDQETGRQYLSSDIGEAAARQSDLLGFEIAIETGHPGSVMCAYNRVNEVYACENDWLLNQVLKRDWGFKGYVMSDWGAVHATVPSANAGLDQESAAATFDAQPYFAGPLQDAIKSGAVPQARLDDMVRRILRSLFADGVIDHPVAIAPIDFAADAKVSQADAEQAIVLLKNDGNILPLSPHLKRIAVIGIHADVGVLSGGGSAQVFPVGGNAVPNIGPQSFPGPIVYFPSSPLQAIHAMAPGAEVDFADGQDFAVAAKLAAQADVVIFFAQQWTAESADAPLTMPHNQDAAIANVARANPHTVVVLETGGPVLMPWVDQVPGLLETWYPGTRGGEAIARVLFGAVVPSGRLPISFPRSLDQLPRPVLDGDPKNPTLAFDVHYGEGAAVGYKWYDKQGLAPLYPFGYGLSYGSTRYANLTAAVVGGTARVEFDVTNTGTRASMDVPQIYASPVDTQWEAPKRLAGWRKLALVPGQSTHVTLTVDRRLLATWDSAAGDWFIAAGRYQIILAKSSRQIEAQATVVLPEEKF